MKEQLKQIIMDSLKKMDIDFNDIIIEIPKDNQNGDYASNVAMKLSKVLNKNPRDIAKMIIDEINSDLIVKTDIAGPGFINFYVNKNYLFDNINDVIEQGEQYGGSHIGNNIKVNVEYVSANPTGTLHLGHARGACYGDSLTRILTKAGYDVTREYYINDGGNQIANLDASIKARYHGICGLEENMPEAGYYGKEIIDVANKIYNEFGNNADETIFKEKGVEYLLDAIKDDLKEMRIEFDIWSSEKDILDSGKVDKVLKQLKDSGNTYIEEDALWLKTSNYGDEKDRVLIKKDGNHTYLLPDIAYHMNKCERKFDIIVDVLGADHHGYINRLKASLQILGENPDKLNVEILQMVRLVRGKEEIKMSKRTGNSVTINELIEEVGLDATRYFFVARSLDTQLDFDLDLATKQSNENPVYYIQYAYARINSIIKEYNGLVDYNMTYKTIESDYAFQLMTKMYEFKDVLETCALKKCPHIMANYAYDLASLFHTFYAHEKILTDDALKTSERINLIKACSIIIKNALNLLGVEAKERM